jgi:hypothetical protein
MNSANPRTNSLAHGGTESRSEVQQRHYDSGQHNGVGRDQSRLHDEFLATAGSALGIKNEGVPSIVGILDVRQAIDIRIRDVDGLGKHFDSKHCTSPCMDSALQGEVLDDLSGCTSQDHVVHRAHSSGCLTFHCGFNSNPIRQFRDGVTGRLAA